MANIVLIYSDLVTNRLNYIFSFFFNELFDLDYELTSDFTYFNQSKLPKFTYARKKAKENTGYFEAHPLLFENEIREITIDYFEFNNTPAFFKSNKDSFFPFDVFAASFYLLSRYEEYLPHIADKFGRFPANRSLAFKYGFLEEPIIDTWSVILKTRLLELFPALRIRKRSFSFIPTIDIDNAYAHLHKGVVRTLLSTAQTLIKKPSGLIEKISVLTRKNKDPYDNYDFLNEVHKKYQIESIYFILFSKYGKNDKNLSIRNKSFQKLIKSIAKDHKIGLHPSFQSNFSNQKLLEEKKNLELLLGKSIEISRQHFLMLNLPATYENLIKAGIKHDYSMGFASQPGFRAGTCTPFHFFNLKTNKKTDLQIVPFAVMDVCFKDYLKCSPEEALKKIKKIITSIKKVDGLFVSLWHNESLDPKNQHFTWRHAYEGMLNEAKNRA